MSFSIFLQSFINLFNQALAHYSSFTKMSTSIVLGRVNWKEKMNFIQTQTWSHLIFSETYVVKQTKIVWELPQPYIVPKTKSCSYKPYKRPLYQSYSEPSDDKSRCRCWRTLVQILILTGSSASTPWARCGLRKSKFPHPRHLSSHTSRSLVAMERSLGFNRNILLVRPHNRVVLGSRT